MQEDETLGEMEGGERESRDVGARGTGMLRKEMLSDGLEEDMSLDWTLEERKCILWYRFGL